MKNKYRIVLDNYAGFEVQIKRWWFPFWMQVGIINTHLTFEAAERFARRHMNKGAKNKVVKELTE